MSKDPFANAIPDEPPPAYSAQGTTIASGPARPDFSGPPPVNEPLEANITGVGIGYGRRTDAGPSRPPPPSSPRPPTLPSRPDPHPTTVPTPGRPLLHRNQLLVYPKDYWCQKCGNTGYKHMDPSNPHETDWKKYGKPYSSALAHSYAMSSSGNPSTTESSNLQRPLPSHPPAPQQPGIWTHPGHARPPPPNFAPLFPPAPPAVFTGNTWVPPGATVVRPGDPRLGGYICPRCRGSGRETDWLGFDDGKCWQCRGVGRVY